MSLLSWLFPKRKAAAPAPEAARRGAPSVPGRPDLSRLDPAAVRKVERAERREWVYSVVREAMLHAGILSSRYKFKVLALDERGRRFLVMVDLAREIAGDTVQLLRVEEQVAQTAKARYDLDVGAVYWRTNDHIDQGRARAQSQAEAGKAAAAAVSTPPAPAAPVSIPVAAAARAAAMAGPASGPVARPSGRFEPIQADELEAFKRALAADRGRDAGPGELRRSGPRSRAGGDFADTQMIEPEERPEALGNTQYGDLR